MTGNNPLIRNIEVLVGPLADFEGGGNPNDGLRIASDGSRENLRAAFSIRKTLQSVANEGAVTIYNLPRESRERMRRGLTRVRVMAGYANTGTMVVGNGGLLDAVHTNQSGTWVSELPFYDGFGGIARGVVNRTFTSGVTVANVIRTLVEQNMPGVTVGRIDVDGTIARGGYAMSDRTADVLDDLATQYGFSWSVQNGVFQALSDQRVFGRVFEISFENRNLISASPITQDAADIRFQTGVEIVAILDARVSPGDSIDLTSSSNPQVNGRYKVHAVQFDGDTGDVSWTMTIQSYRF